MKLALAGTALVFTVNLASAQTVQLTLGQALARADSASPGVGIARAGVNGAQADVMRARSAMLPQINGSASYTRTLASQFSGFSSSSTSSDSFPAPTNCGHYVPRPELPVSQRIDSLERGLDCAANGSSIDFSKLPFGRKNIWSFGLTGSQVLFDKRIGGQVKAADAARDQAETELVAQRANAVFAVAEAYLDAQLAERLMEITDSTLAQAERTYNQTRLERQVGNAADFDLLRATVARDNQRPLIIQRRALRDQALLRLKQLLDLPATATLVLATPLGDTTSVALPASVSSRALSDTAIDSRAPVQQAAAGVRASEARLGSARGEHWPTVSLSSTLTKLNYPTDVFSFDRFLTDWTAGVFVSVPIFNGWRTRASALAAEAARDAASERLKQARQQATLESQDARNGLDAAQAALLASAGTAQSAQRAYDIAEIRYRNGLSTLTELGDVRVQLEQAQANAALAVRDLQLARVRLALLRDLPFGTGMTTPTARTATATSGGSN